MVVDAEQQRAFEVGALGDMSPKLEERLEQITGATTEISVQMWTQEQPRVCVCVCVTYI